MLVKRQVILAAVESTSGSKESLDPAANAILVNTVAITNANARMVARNPIKATLDPLPAVFAGTLGQIQIQVEVKGSDKAGVSPEISPLLQACGMKETVNADTSVIYEPVSSDHESITIEAYQDGRLYTLIGCRGTFTATVNAGEIMLFDFTITGHYDSHNDTALPSPTYSAVVPPPVINLSGLKMGTSYVPKVSSLTFDIGNEIVTPADITDEMGFGDVIISGRAVTGTLDPEMVKVSTKDFLKEWMEMTTTTLTTGPIGDASVNEGNQITIAFTKISISDYAQGERDSLLTEAITFACHETIGDDVMSITFE